MKDIQFPLFKTKNEEITQAFNLEDPVGRREDFEAKAGEEITKIREFLEGNTFIAILLGKKNSGKGTYTKLFIDAVGSERVAHLSIGDIVRDVHTDLSSPNKKQELTDYLKNRYRGFIAIDKIKAALEGSKYFRKVTPSNVGKGIREGEVKFEMSMDIVPKGEES